MSDLTTQEQEQEQNKKKKKKKKGKRGRPKNVNYLPWEEARAFVHNEMIPSRGKYEEWWQRNKPKTIPRFPYRVYKEFTTWNDFLGTSNQFGVKIGTKWRPFGEAVKWAQTLNIKTYEEWLDFIRNKENLPADIPARPDLVYKEWRTWGYWLGNTPANKVLAAQETQKVAIFYIIHERNVPLNVFTYDVEPLGLSALKSRWETEKFEVVRLFWHDPEQSQKVKQIIEAFSTPYLENHKQRITPNVWELITRFEFLLEKVQKTSSQ